MTLNNRVRAGVARILIAGVALVRRVRSNIAWSLVIGVVTVEWHQPQRVALILGLAALYAVLSSLFDAVNERWPKPILWRLPQGRGPGKGAA